MTTPKLPPRHPNPAILVERRREAQDIADQSVALAMTLAADYGKALELRPDFWGRPFLDYKAGYPLPRPGPEKPAVSPLTALF